MRHRTIALVCFGIVSLAACGPSSGNGDDDNGGPDGSVTGDECEPGASEACYFGTPGTENVGTCHGGTRTCSASGYWGSCLNQITPINEVCANSLDDDCNGTADDVTDLDGDGFTACEGDCCETTDQCGDPTRVNPAAEEAQTTAPNIPVDDNCDGTVDEPISGCDGSLALASPNAMDAARAIGLCREALGPYDSGVTSALFTRASGAGIAANQQVGIETGFGTNVPAQEGTQLFGISSGHARLPNETGACGTYSCTNNLTGTPPAGFPQDTPNCAGSSAINDDIALDLHLRAPSNAVGFSVDFAFYSFEYPEWVCTSYNDQFVILMNPAPTGSINGNIAFDANNNPVSVNIGFFQVCAGCPAGTAALTGNGFDTWDDAGATVWLRSTAPVTPNQEFTLRFIIWDTGDQSWDSTAIIDNFQWILEGTVGVDTTPVD